MIRITIGLILIIGFIQSLFLNNQVIWNGYMLIGAAIPMVIGLILIAFGLRKKWSDIKKELTGWGNERISTITKVYFSDFDAFLDKYIAKSIPHFTLLCMSFMGVIMISANPFNPYFGTWLFWPIAILLSPLYGLMIYLLGGFVYQLTVSICGAKWDPPLSRKVFIYALMPSYLAAVVSSLFFYFVYHTRSLDLSADKYSILIWSIIIFIASIYAFIHSNRAAKKVLNAKPVRSFILFLLIPIALNIIFLGNTVMGAFGYIDTLTASQSGISSKLTDIESAQANLDMGDYNSAKLVYEKVVSNEANTGFTDDVAQAYLGIASIKMSQGDVEDGLSIINETLKKTKEGTEVDYMLKGLMAIVNKDIEGAFNIFNEVIKINPNNYDANAWLGIYYIGQVTDYEKAIIYNKKAHEIKKTIEGLEMLAANYYLLGSYSESKVLFEELNRVAPNNTTSLLKLGEISYGFGDKDGAIKYFKRLKEIDPSKITPQIEDTINEKI